MAKALRDGGVYYVGGRLENGKLTGGRWLDANGNEVDAPTSGERGEARAEQREADEAARAAIAEAPRVPRRGA